MGLILVFDLDDTIAHMRSDSIVQINQRILNIFNYIKQNALRGSVIDTIFLLTNNSIKKYIKYIDNLLLMAIGSTGAFKGGEQGYPVDNYFFDYIMDYVHSSRNYDKTKSIEDVVYMLDKLNISYSSTADIMSRTFFFDDQEHNMRIDMSVHGFPDHYIKITPPFTIDDNDKTNYYPVLDSIQKESQTLIGGGKRSRYKKRRTLRRIRKNKRKTYRI